MSNEIVHEWIYEWATGQKTPYVLIKRPGKYHDSEPYDYVIDYNDGSFSGQSIIYFPPVTTELARLAERVKKLAEELVDREQCWNTEPCDHMIPCVECWSNRAREKQ